MEKTEILSKDLTYLNLSNRTFNALAKPFGSSKKITNIQELLKLDVKELKKYRGLGEKGITELLITLHMLGLKFDFENEIDNINNINNINNIPSAQEYLTISEEIERKKEIIRKEQKEIELLQEKLQLIKLGISNEVEDKKM